jgi:hypothetical protein
MGVTTPLWRKTIMTLKVRSAKRFSSPTVLRGDAPFLGATVQVWDDALTGNMEKSLAKVKKLAMGNGPKKDVSKATTFDLASFAGKRLATAR